MKPFRQSECFAVTKQLKGLATAAIGRDDLAAAQKLLSWISSIESWAESGGIPPPELELARNEVELAPNEIENSSAVGESTWSSRPTDSPDQQWDDSPVEASRLKLLREDEFDTTRLHRFPGIVPQAFQHPLDLQALAGLQNVPLLDNFVRLVSGQWFERQTRLVNNAHCVRIGPNQASSIYRKFEEAAAILDLDVRPDIYVSTAYVVNATATGVNQHQITLYSGLIDVLTEAELMAVIGHELGHIKCQHMLYRSVAHLVRTLGLGLLDQIPGGIARIAAYPALLAVFEWYRKAEFSCDRAALLVVQDPKIVATALTKLAGGSRKILPELNLDAIIQQAEDFEESDGSLFEKVLRLNMLLEETHPFPILRVREIMAWGNSPDFKNIMEGKYKRRPLRELRAYRGPVALKCANAGCKKRLNPVSALFCGGCGRSTRDAVRVCGNCESDVGIGWTTCRSCDASLEGEDRAANT